MKKLFTITVAAALCNFGFVAFAQTATTDATQLVDAAKATGDSKLGDIATELTGKVQALGSAADGNAAVTNQLGNLLKSLTGGEDSSALTSAYGLVKDAGLTPDQMGLAKQVGNLASAYVVQKNFASLTGSQGDVSTIVSSLCAGKIQAAVPALKNVATSAKLTDTQKQLIKTVADKYAPGLSKASDALDAVKKLPGF